MDLVFVFVVAITVGLGAIAGRFSRLNPLIVGAMLGAIPAAMFIFALAGEVAFNLTGGVIALIAPVGFGVFVICSGIAAIGASLGSWRKRLHKGN